MGDRAVICLHSDDGNEWSPCIYSHWSGTSIPEYIEELKGVMKDRKNDVAYAAARFVQIGCNHAPDTSLSWGVWNQNDNPVKMTDKQRADLSHGDAGFFLVNANDFTWTCYDGYLETKK